MRLSVHFAQARFLQRGWFSDARKGLTLVASLSAFALAALLPASAAADPRTSRTDLVYQPAAAIPVVAVQFLNEATADALLERFATANYDVDAVLAGTQSVPRLYTSALPRDLRALDETDTRKLVFIGTMLPLVLMANEEILSARRELERLLAKQAAGEGLTAVERDWLEDLADYYGADADDSDELLSKVDALPVSLTLAQAILESGWGTSRYAREGNALFGQRTWRQDVPGLVARKDGQTLGHKARAFADLMQSVRGYMQNLNSNRAFKQLRRERAKLRDAGKPLDGALLAGYLGHYAEAETYADHLRRLIRHNDLDNFEGARLSSGTLAEVRQEATSFDPGS